MSTAIVYNRQELCDAMGCGYKRARKILEEHGVDPIDYGKGRAGGLRWLRESVNAVLHTMATQNAPKKKGRVCRHHTVAGKSAETLISEFTKRMPIQ